MSHQQQISMSRVRKINHHNQSDLNWLKMLKVECRTKTKADKHFGYTVNVLYRLGADNPHAMDYRDGKYAPRTFGNPLPEHALYADVYIIQYVKKYSRQTKFDDVNKIERNPLTDFHSLYLLGDEVCKQVVASIHNGRRCKSAAAADLDQSTTSTSVIDSNVNVDSPTNIQLVSKSYLCYDLHIRDEKEMAFLHFLTQTGDWYISQNGEGACYVTNEVLGTTPAFDGYQLTSLTGPNGQFAAKLMSIGTWHVKLDKDQRSYILTPVIKPE